jgi:hypothetical protein
MMANVPLSRNHRGPQEPSHSALYVCHCGRLSHPSKKGNRIDISESEWNIHWPVNMGSCGELLIPSLCLMPCPKRMCSPLDRHMRLTSMACPCQIM